MIPYKKPPSRHPNTNGLNCRIIFVGPRITLNISLRNEHLQLLYLTIELGKVLFSSKCRNVFLLNAWMGHSRNTQFPKFGIHQPFLGTTAICEDLGQRTHHRGEVSLNGWPLVWLVCIWPSKKQRVHCTSPRQNKQEVSRTVILSLKLELSS